MIVLQRFLSNVEKQETTNDKMKGEMIEYGCIEEI